MRLEIRSGKSFGAIAAEFAIGFPMLLLLIMMLVDAGLYLFQRALLTDSTARLNRAIVTQLGQLEAEASFYGTSVSCNDFISKAKELKTKIATEKEILYRDMTFWFKVKTTAPIPYRLITTGGEKPFVCLTCKFFPLSLNIMHTSVLVIERPPYITQACNDLSWYSLDNKPGVFR